MYIRSIDGFGQAEATIDVAKAVRNNRIYAKTLGWDTQYDKIARFLGFTEKPSESAFAQAIARWQQTRGMKVDGMIGASTWKAMLAAISPGTMETKLTDTIKPAAARLIKFDKNSAKLKDFHIPDINGVADRVVASWKTGQPIFTVYVKGHTSAEGPAQYNIGLGYGRALAVRKALQKALERKQKNLSYKVLILAQSKGVKEPIDTNETEEGKSQNRRVEIFLSTKALMPLPKKDKPTEIIFEDTDVIRPRRPSEWEVPPPDCRREDYREKKRICLKQDLGCKAGCVSRAMFAHITSASQAWPCLALLPLGLDKALACAATKAPEVYLKIVQELLKCRDDCNSRLLSCVDQAKRDTNCR
jgi:outer membrane protein OmpA-like peptidoglycan-associated protein